MDKMDSSNGIAWFENIFQKFEDMFPDVDELMKQAESQLVTVGTNVKNFFSELDIIGDALPQSSVDKKQGAAPDSFMVQKTDTVVGIKSQVGTDGGRDDGVHIGSVESVKSISSGLSLEEIDDGIETKKFQLPTSDKKDAGNANQEMGLDSGAKFLIPASDDVGGCITFKDTEDRSTNLVDMSSKVSDDKIDSSNANQEIGLDSGAKLLIPASDDVGGCYSFMETEDRSRNLVDMSSKIADDTLLPDAFNMEILCKKSAAGIEPCPADTSAISGISNCNGAANLTTSATEPEGIELYNSSDESDATTPLPESEERDNDVTKSGLQTLGSLETVELGESCIVVDQLGESCIVVDCTGLECNSGEAVKHRSYKKKLKDAFASKMRLLKKHNNDEQKRQSYTTPALPEKSNSPDYEFCESDWEIV